MDSVLYDTHAVRYSNCPLRASDHLRNKPKVIVSRGSVCVSGDTADPRCGISFTP